MRCVEDNLGCQFMDFSMLIYGTSGSIFTLRSIYFHRSALYLEGNALTSKVNLELCLFAACNWVGSNTCTVSSTSGAIELNEGVLGLYGVSFSNNAGPAIAGSGDCDNFCGITISDSCPNGYEGSTTEGSDLTVHDPNGILTGTLKSYTIGTCSPCPISQSSSGGRACSDCPTGSTTFGMSGVAFTACPFGLIAEDV